MYYSIRSVFFNFLQKYRIYRIKKLKLVKLGCLGLEPRTNRLKAEYSTIELAAHVKTIAYNY